MGGTFCLQKSPCQEDWWLPCRSVNLESWDVSLRSSLAAYVILKKSVDWQRADLCVEPSLRVCTLREERVFSLGFYYCGYVSTFPVFHRGAAQSEQPVCPCLFLRPGAPGTGSPLPPPLHTPAGKQDHAKMTRKSHCWVSEAGCGGA